MQYVNGRFYGEENGKVTKTLLCVMLKSITSKYGGIGYMSHIVTIAADTIEKLWKNVLEQVTSIGFDVAVTMTDGHSANMRFFNKKLLNDSSSFSLSNPWKLGCWIFFSFDTVHLFKMSIIIGQIRNFSSVLTLKSPKKNLN